MTEKKSTGPRGIVGGRTHRSEMRHITEGNCSLRARECKRCGTDNVWHVMIYDEMGLTARELPHFFRLMMGNPPDDLAIGGWWRHHPDKFGVLQCPIGYVDQIQIRVEFKKP